MIIFKVCLLLLCVSCGTSEEINQYNSDGQKIGIWLLTNEVGDTLKIDVYSQESELIESTHFGNNGEQTKTIYEDGDLTKQISYYSSGSVKYAGGYKGEYMNGKNLSFYEDGTPQLTANFDMNKLVGEYIQYYPNGIIQNKTSDMRNGVMHFYDSLGNSRFDIQIVNGRPGDTLKVY